MECPKHKKLLVKLPVKNPVQKCEMCGMVASHQCQLCKFQLCSCCRICDKKHFLVKVVWLSKIKPEYTEENYICSSCKQSKVGNDDGIWHCHECDYDVCP